MKLAGRQFPKVKPLGVIPETDNIVTARDRSVTNGIRACPRPEVCRRGRRTLRGVECDDPALRVDCVDATLTWLEKQAGR